MFRAIKRQLAASLKAEIARQFGLDHDPVAEIPPRRGLGDLAFPTPLHLAKSLKIKPRDIARRWRRVAPAGRGARAPRRRRGLFESVLRPLGVRRRFACRTGLHRAPGRPDGHGERSGRGPRPPALRRARSSSSTPTSIRTRRRTSAICATRCSATPSSACCAPGGPRSRCRTTSTTPASRWPTSWSASHLEHGRPVAEVRGHCASRSTSSAGISTREVGTYYKETPSA